MFHFGYSGSFLEEYNKVPQSPNTAVSIYKQSAIFDKGGKYTSLNSEIVEMRQSPFNYTQSGCFYV